MKHKREYNLQDVVRSLDEAKSRSENRHLRRQMDAQDFDSMALGHGRLANLDDIETKGLLSGTGVPIGFFTDKNGDEHALKHPRGSSGLIYGAPGLGKDSTLIAHILGESDD
ncbi:MAG: hypothetical protein AAFQ58_08255 [Pseudomonadota bacterium]